MFVFTRSGSVWTQQAELVASEQVEGGPTETCPSELDEAGQCRFGRSASLSADGNTALVGSARDNGNTGAAWVFTRSGSTWTQQGKKLTGAGESPEGRFGKSVALSPDGTTALIGGPSDRAGLGSAWVFARSGAEWTQQAKLGRPEKEGEDHFGWSVALSADGNTSIVGGPTDATRVGAAWVFTRSESKWSQQGELTADDEAGEGRFGYSVALSDDGDTALIGAHKDNGGDGAAWAFTRSGSTWTQQGEKLTGEGAGGEFGYDVALSADGGTALIGAPHADSHIGAAWEFARSDATWAQLGEKLTGSVENGKGWFGASVALSAQADTALIGGPHDNGNAGAAWTFLTIAVPPTVTSISPTSGPSSGETSVTIHGSGFLPGATVKIGNPATAVNVLSETEITAVTAATPAGGAEVVVSDENGTSTGGPTYTYIAPSSPPSTPTKSVSETPGGEEEGGNTPGGGVLGSVASVLPPPKLGVTGNLFPAGGTVLVKLPGSSTFVLLTKALQVPFGTIVNAIHGRVTVTTIGPKGRLQTITYYEGMFRLSQRRNGQVVATLVGGNFSICRQAVKHGHGARASASRRSRKTVRKLWGDGHGSYSTKGNYAAGAVLGTRWLTEDRCDGTLIRVVTDRVKVTNQVNHRQVTVRAGHSYLAKAP